MPQVTQEVIITYSKPKLTTTETQTAHKHSKCCVADLPESTITSTLLPPMPLVNDTIEQLGINTHNRRPINTEVVVHRRRGKDNYFQTEDDTKHSTR